MTDSAGSVTGKRIILEIVREMRDGLHPLLYSRVAPGLYCVYLHPEDFSRLEGLVPRIRIEAQRALAEEMQRLNEPQRSSALRWFVAEESAPPIEVPAAGWEIQLEPDRDDEVGRGSFVILSRLTLPALPQFEGGVATTKVFKTVVSGSTRTKTEQVFASLPAVASAPIAQASIAQAPISPAPASGQQVPPSPPRAYFDAPASSAAVFQATPSETATGPVAPATGDDRPSRGLAQITVQDARGHRVFVMDKQDIKIGRGGQFRIVDLQLDGPTRISRVHARIRRDDQGRFFIKDLSEWGTTVNGERLKRGVIKDGDAVREIDVEAELPPRARIGLADTLFMDFAATPQTAAVTTSTATAPQTETESPAEQPAPDASRPASGEVIIGASA
jgi:pSer/pThr/pTyr-binding forkhead associated (FHA) protein